MAQALGQSYYSQKMIPKAQEEYEKAIALRPDLPGLPLELGEIYTATSQWTNAECNFVMRPSCNLAMQKQRIAWGMRFHTKGK